MPDENEQDALSKIKAYLDAGHGIDAIRGAGWASWIDHLEGKGYDLKTGMLALLPPQEAAPKDALEPTAGRLSQQPPTSEPSAIERNAAPEVLQEQDSAERDKERESAWQLLWRFAVVAPFTLVALWWRWATARSTGWGKFVAIAGPPLAVIVVVAAIAGTVGGNDDSPDEGEPASVAAELQSPSTDEIETSSASKGDDKPAESRQSAQQKDDRANDPPEPDTSNLTMCLNFTDGMAVALGAASDSMSAIVDLSLQAGIDPLVLLTSTWQDNLRGEYNRLRNTRADVGSIESPNSEFAAVKAQTLEALDLLLASEAPLLTGADNLDADSISLATDYLTRATAAFAVGTAMIERIDLSVCAN